MYMSVAAFTVDLRAINKKGFVEKNSMATGLLMYFNFLLWIKKYT